MQFKSESALINWPKLGWGKLLSLEKSPNY